MNQLKDRPNGEHSNYKTGAGYKGCNFNTYQNQWSPLKCDDDWCHKDECCHAPEAGHSRSLTSTSSQLDRRCVCDVSCDDAETDEEDFEENRQNNSCNYCTCYDSDFDLEGRRSYQRGTNKHRKYGEPTSATDAHIPCELQLIFDKILRVAKWGKQRLHSPDLEPMYGITDHHESPPVLAPQKEPPHTRNLVRVKSFKRHQMYQRMWKAQPAIGENFRFSMRQKVRQKMLKKDEVQLPHKVFVPNLYVVPTVKPRYNLRWTVRKCNHDYMMPPVGNYYDF